MKNYFSFIIFYVKDERRFLISCFSKKSRNFSKNPESAMLSYIKFTLCLSCFAIFGSLLPLTCFYSASHFAPNTEVHDWWTDLCHDWRFSFEILIRSNLPPCFVSEDNFNALIHLFGRVVIAVACDLAVCFTIVLGLHYLEMCHLVVIICCRHLRIADWYQCRCWLYTDNKKVCFPCRKC